MFRDCPGKLRDWGPGAPPARRKLATQREKQIKDKTNVPKVCNILLTWILKGILEECFTPWHFFFNSLFFWSPNFLPAGRATGSQARGLLDVNLSSSSRGVSSRCHHDFVQNGPRCCLTSPLNRSAKGSGPEIVNLCGLAGSPPTAKHIA